MANVLLVPGAGGAAWYWHRLVPLLEAAGHRAVAVDLHGEDPSRGLPQYAQTALSAVPADGEVVLVGQSMGAFTVAMTAQQCTPRAVILLNPMTPIPGETPGQWWEATGQPAAMAAADAAAGRTAGFDVNVHLLHDLPNALRREAENHDRIPASTPFAQPCTFTAWPAAPMQVLVATDDRFFPPDFQRRLTDERLGCPVIEVAGGHLAALTQPADVASALLTAIDREGWRHSRRVRCSPLTASKIDMARATKDNLQAEIDRLVGLGASRVEYRRVGLSNSWTVILDPEGNEFCIG